MRGMTHEEYDRLCAEHPYYAGRWPYFEVAMEMGLSVSPTSALELGPGPGGVPLLAGSDTMDLTGATICHDAWLIPWPVADKAYDLFVALQVWEHLDGRQVEAFAEARRVARWGLFSFPLKWEIIRHHVTREDIAEWTHGLPPVREEEINIFGRRLVMLFEFGEGVA